MRVSDMYAHRAYGLSNRQEEALVARNTEDKETQMRIAENSDERLVLMNLAMNKNINEEAVQTLYSRDLDYVSNRLDSLGYKKDSFLGGLFK